MIRKKVSRPSDGTFTGPELLPANSEEQRNWQQANKSFWEDNSMRYDWDEAIGHAEFSAGFYHEIDKRFFSAVKAVMPWKERPFEQYLDFVRLKDMDVLEIGVGNGSHAQLIAPRAKSYTGIDLTEYAVRSTSGRMRLNAIPAPILQMDAEQMQSPDATFDYVWSWGVIHHSSNTSQILDEIRRVLRPGGTALIMVYYRGWFSYYLSGFLHGLFGGYFLRGKTLHQAVQARPWQGIIRSGRGAGWQGGVLTSSTWRCLAIKPISSLFPAGRSRRLYSNGSPDDWQDG